MSIYLKDPRIETPVFPFSITNATVQIIFLYRLKQALKSPFKAAPSERPGLPARGQRRPPPHAPGAGTASSALLPKSPVPKEKPPGFRLCQRGLRRRTGLPKPRSPAGSAAVTAARQELAHRIAPTAKRPK